MPYSVPDRAAGTALPWLKEEASVFGKGPLIVAGIKDADRFARAELSASILVGMDESGTAPDVGDIFDLYLTTMPMPPRPWVHVTDIAETVEALQNAVTANPVAAVTLLQVLRAQRGAPFEPALHIESLAYSTLLGGAEFRRWRAANPVTDGKRQEPNPEPAVVMERYGDKISIELARPENDNATTAEMRDALVEALRVARLDETITTVEIRGRGRVFCSGGALGEFGTAQDLAMAHQLRTVRSVALELHRLGSRSRIFIQGAAVGGGMEFAAAGHELIARSSAFFQLPEIAMGLIPGAGGTVTVARRIGWQRLAYIALTGARLRARTALAWGLIDRIDDA
jgi:hypothetical protein